MARTKAVKEVAEKSETELLREEIEQLKKLLLEKESEKEIVKSESNDEEEGGDLRPDTYIKVMSLCPHLLILNGSPEGRGGKVFRFLKFGEVKKIQKSYVDNIVENNRRFLDEGYFIFISPKSAIKSYALEEIYERILTKEKIEKILRGNHSDAVNLFKMTTDSQREKIILLILDKMMAGERFDDNLLYRLSEVMGPGYSIRERYAKMLDAKKEYINL